MIMEALFYVLLFVVAFLYASVGHGGASGYLALMALFSFLPEEMRSSALLLNLIVSLISFLQYYHAGHFKWKLFYPFAITSIPAAFLGGVIVLEANWYKKILAVLLLFSVFRFLGYGKGKDEVTKEQSISLSLVIGLFIGLFSGMIGIGGGIILSPVILLLHWANIRETAAVSALFIFVNSLSGLAGVYMKGVYVSDSIYMMILIALLGGGIGSFYGAKKMNTGLLRYTLAFVLLMASVKLILI